MQSVVGPRGSTALAARSSSSRVRLAAPRARPAAARRTLRQGVPQQQWRGSARQAGGRSLLAEAISEGEAATTDVDSPDDWQLKYLYDGDCALCRSMKQMLERNNERGAIKFVNIADLDYEPEQHEGIEYEDAMDTIHAVRKSGEVLTGPEALTAMYDAVGMGWYGQLSSMPVVSQIIDLLYEIISRLRLPIGKGMDAVIAAKRLKMSTEGKDTCGEHEECDAPEW